MLGRTQGNVGFAAFYALFVVACAIHVPIGLKSIAEEWLGWRRRPASWVAAAFGLLVLLVGLRAVYAVSR